MLELSGCIVTVDADYVLALKGNHAVVHEEVKTFLEAAVAERLAPPRKGGALSAAAASLGVWETTEKGHERIETRRYYQSTAWGPVSRVEGNGAAE